MKLRSLALLAVILCTLVPAYSDAQTDLRYGETDLSVSLSPEYPAPGETVRFRARSTLADLDSYTVTWYVDDSASASGRGLADFQMTAGEIGSETSVRVGISDSSGEAASTEVLVRPTEVDLLWEADSYVPQFYGNRALPSAGSKIRLQAIPRFIANGASVPASDIVFSWRRNGYAIASVSGAGRSSVVIDAPSLFGTDTITVVAENARTGLSGSASARLQTREPVLDLYENHSLFGVMYHNAFGAQTSLGEVEKSFVAIPYFAPSAPRALSFEWEVNGQSIPSNSARPNEITVNAANSNGLALIELAVTSATNLFLDSFRSWGIALSNSSVSDPFRSAP